MSEYKNGQPCWTELRSTARKTSAAFYEGLFGWEVRGEHNPIASATIGGHLVAGIGPVLGQWGPGWVSFFSVADAEATSTAIGAAGGSILEPVSDIGTLGRAGLFTDSVGSRFALWQAGELAGAELSNQPGALSWNELISDDVNSSIAFYGAVFGWTAGKPEGPLGRREFQSDGRPVAGLLPKGPHMPVELKPYWDVYFQTADTDAAAAAVPALGGQIALPPIDIDRGRLAVFVDPTGAIFSVIAPQHTEQDGAV